MILAIFLSGSLNLDQTEFRFKSDDNVNSCKTNTYDVIECDNDGVPHIDGRWKVEWPDE